MAYKLEEFVSVERNTINFSWAYFIVMTGWAIFLSYQSTQDSNKQTNKTKQKKHKQKVKCYVLFCMYIADRGGEDGESE